MLDNLSRARDGRTHRLSSWDTSGRNRDAWPIPAGETATLAEIRGAGVIRHLWFTVSADDPLYLRRCVVRIHWDGEESSSVEVPVGDFFGVGHGRVASYSCAVMNMSANHGDEQHAAMNCYWPMPFANGARITVENQATGREGVDMMMIDAYWYQTPRERPLPPLRPVAERLPRPDATVQPVDLPTAPKRRMSGSPYRA